MTRRFPMEVTDHERKVLALAQRMGDLSFTSARLKAKIEEARLVLKRLEDERNVVLASARQAEAEMLLLIEADAQADLADPRRGVE